MKKIIEKISVFKVLELLLTGAFWIYLVITVVTVIGFFCVLFIGDDFVNAILKLQGMAATTVFMPGPGTTIYLHNQPVEPILNKLWLYGFFSLFIHYVIRFLIVWRLRAVFKTLSQGNPFVYKNVNEIRVVAVIFVTGTLAKNYVRYLTGLLVNPYITIKDFEMSVFFRLDWTIMLAGGIFLVLAEVFKKAIELKEENDLTI